MACNPDVGKKRDFNTGGRAATGQSVPSGRDAGNIYDFWERIGMSGGTLASFQRRKNGTKSER